MTVGPIGSRTCGGLVGFLAVVRGNSRLQVDTYLNGNSVDFQKINTGMAGIIVVDASVFM